ncbi:hypothetical protein Srot_1568 [Segniliparus rotundus DSM 44985]|uniref:Uncharacterized protein n=1 Tax=Segniliparus rotundus (strain ATCC BAA-972 / CDC 1076 / CIP 108378 / DSM 44985 / JCM 13578) TaxID=640132 RepID=D6Z7V0_SEGRD|nr:hypothetical protein Srot_1568 [Segniliparus rotundus DSM 44985]
MADFHERLDKAYADKPLAELLNAPADAVEGVRERDAEKRKAACTIKTVRDLGTNKFFLWAQAAVALGSQPRVRSVFHSAFPTRRSFPEARGLPRSLLRGRTELRGRPARVERRPARITRRQR